MLIFVLSLVGGIHLNHLKLLTLFIANQLAKFKKTNNATPLNFFRNTLDKMAGRWRELVFRVCYITCTIYNVSDRAVSNIALHVMLQMPRETS